MAYTKKYKKRQHHKKRQFRISDETMKELEKLKRGTWEYTFKSLLRNQSK